MSLPSVFAHMVATILDYEHEYYDKSNKTNVKDPKQKEIHTMVFIPHHIFRALSEVSIRGVSAD